MNSILFRSRFTAWRRQRGIVLFTVLIALVILSLSAVALVRSIDTGTEIAGNLVFRQTASQAADSGTEAALTWLQNEMVTNGTTSLYTSKTSGYYANSRTGCDLSGTATPGNAIDDVQWDSKAAGNRNCNMVAADVGSALLPDGYRASYVINRMCNQDGNPVAVVCDIYTRTSSSADQGRSMTSIGYYATGAQGSAYFYRITTRVVGPKGTTSFVQTVLLN